MISSSCCFIKPQKDEKSAIGAIHQQTKVRSRRSPVKRTPIPTLTLRTHIRRMTFLSLDFLRRDKFRFAFFAFVKVHHVTIKEPLLLIKTFFSKKGKPQSHTTASFQSILKRRKHYDIEKNGDHVTKKNTTQPNTPAEKKDDDRETKILNLLCNTSLILMTMITEAVSQVFTNLTKEMVTALSASFDAPQDTSGTLDELEKNLPDTLRKELMTMKSDLQKQLNEKKQDLGSLLADPRFDTGIAIVERVSLPFPKLTTDLDERSLFGYLALLQTENPQVTAMFKELFEWMNTLPHLGKKEE